MIIQTSTYIRYNFLNTDHTPHKFKFSIRIMLLSLGFEKIQNYNESLKYKHCKYYFFEQL